MLPLLPEGEEDSGRLVKETRERMKAVPRVELRVAPGAGRGGPPGSPERGRGGLGCPMLLLGERMGPARGAFRTAALSATRRGTSSE